MGDDRFGPFPDSRLVSIAFARASENVEDVAAESGCPMLVPIAGLVVAHRRMAEARPDIDEVVQTWRSGLDAQELVATDLNAGPFMQAWQEEQRHMLAIDTEAHRILATPRPDAIEHTERLGTVFSRMARLYTISFGRFVLDGPEGANRKRLTRELAAYESFARGLVDGTQCLPNHEPPQVGAPSPLETAPTGDRPR